PEASSPGAKDENTGAGLCRSRLVVQERLGHYTYGVRALPDGIKTLCCYPMGMLFSNRVIPVTYKNNSVRK
ncbi:hypothetical protein ACSZN5_22090, partial [Aeromonas caviae]